MKQRFLLAPVALNKVMYTRWIFQVTGAYFSTVSHLCSRSGVQRTMFRGYDNVDPRYWIRFSNSNCDSYAVVRILYLSRDRREQIIWNSISMHNVKWLYSHRITTPTFVSHSGLKHIDIVQIDQLKSSSFFPIFSKTVRSHHFPDSWIILSFLIKWFLCYVLLMFVV